MVFQNMVTYIVAEIFPLCSIMPALCFMLFIPYYAKKLCHIIDASLVSICNTTQPAFTSSFATYAGVATAATSVTVQ